MPLHEMKIAVVIPCYKVTKHILDVIRHIPDFVDNIFLVDDKCPEKSGQFVIDNCRDKRVTVLFNEVNLGVGGAVSRGYQEVLKNSIDIAVKIDGDGQMDPTLIIHLVEPIVQRQADYVKGSRFYHMDSLAQMPMVRFIGNTGVSFINKAVSGYWNIMDPSNGFTAISLPALKEIPLPKLSQRYFFESDMLFRLSLARAKVVDFQMDAKYGDEVSNLNVSKVLIGFPPKYLARFFKRIVYQYFFRDFNFGSISLLFGSFFFLMGSSFGLYRYYEFAIVKNMPAPTGTVVLPAMFIILGTQFLISFLQYDVTSFPKTPLTHKKGNS